MAESRPAWVFSGTRVACVQFSLARLGDLLAPVNPLRGITHGNLVVLLNPLIQLKKIRIPIPLIRIWWLDFEDVRCRPVLLEGDSRALERLFGVSRAPRRRRMRVFQAVGPKGGPP